MDSDIIISTDPTVEYWAVMTEDLRWLNFI